MTPIWVSVVDACTMFTPHPPDKMLVFGGVGAICISKSGCCSEASEAVMADPMSEKVMAFSGLTLSAA